MGQEVLNRRERLAKNRQISKTRKETVARHKKMVCKTYEFKVDKSHLSEETAQVLRRLFLEAKWFYNHLIARGEVWDADYAIKTVLVRNKDKLFETRDLTHLSSQMRQEVIDRAKDAIVGLAILKERGHKVGALGFKSRINSIPLKQNGVTYRLKGNRIGIQNIKQPLRIRGVGQIPKGAELTSATLEQRNGDWFVHVTVYQPRAAKRFPLKDISVDAGINKQLTISNGIDVVEGIPVTKKITRLHRELTNREKVHGTNWLKTNLKLNREYDRITNQRRDVKNKVVSRIVSTAKTVHVQDENIAGWQMMWGRRVQTSAIGGVMSALKQRAHTPIVVGRFVPTTKTCSECGNVQEIGLEERVFVCQRCGLRIDRNLNSTSCILNAREDGDGRWNVVPAERRELTPVDTKAATEMLGCFNSIPGVSASPVVETGSHPTFSRW